MDTTKEYILMCKEARKIQKEWKPQVGDYFLTVFKEIDICDCVLHSNKSLSGIKSGSAGTYRKDAIFLPRQDQLQGMVKENNISDGKLVVKFAKRISDECYHDLWNSSMEQFWLAFVMKEKYQKTWNGKIWS